MKLNFKKYSGNPKESRKREKGERGTDGTNKANNNSEI